MPNIWKNAIQRVYDAGDIELAMNLLVAVSVGTMKVAMNGMRKEEQEGEKKSEKRNFVLERHVRDGSKECGSTESAGKEQKTTLSSQATGARGRVRSDQHTMSDGKAPRAALDATTAASVTAPKISRPPCCRLSLRRSHLTCIIQPHTRAKTW